MSVGHVRQSISGPAAQDSTKRLPSRFCRYGTQTGRRLCAGPQGKSQHIVQRRGTALCPIRHTQHAERLEPSTHDRREWRRATVIRDTRLATTHDFPGIVAIARITSRRRLHGGRAKPATVRYYVLSKFMAAKRLLATVRARWSIENQLHWILNVVFDEDRCRARKDNAPENLAILRRLASNIV
jgi:predicted transposase YbfD/YdcC